MYHKFQAKFDVFNVDSKDGVHLDDGRKLHLAPKELAALCLLLQHAGSLVSKDEIIRKLWNNANASENSLTRCISGLKKHLRQVSAQAGDFIQSDYGQGYRFIGTIDDTRSFISDETFYALINASPDFIAFKDGKSRWLGVNQAGLKLYQLENKAWQGKTNRELTKLVPEFRASLEACVASDEAAWDAGTSTYSIEKMQTGQGEKVFHVVKSPLFDAHGNRKTLVVLGRDVTMLLMPPPNTTHTEP